MTTESKLKTGTLTIDGTDFACQATNVTINPDYDEEGDDLEVLCGTELAASATRKDTLKITAIQDFTAPSGFVNFTWDNDLTVVPFSWKPNATGPTYSGDVEVRAAVIGGEINKRVTADVEWKCIGPVDCADA